MASGRHKRLRNESASEDLVDFIGTLWGNGFCHERTCYCNQAYDGKDGKATKCEWCRKCWTSIGLLRIHEVSLRKANRPNLRGTFNLDKAAMEKICSVLAYNEDQKVAFATYMLEIDAEFRWVSTRRFLKSSHTFITWKVFKHEFYKNYFPASIRKIKELEFMKL